MRAVRDAQRQGIKVAAVRVHPETAHALAAISSPLIYPELIVWGLPVVADADLAPGKIVIDPVKVVTRADQEREVLRQLLGNIVIEALGWPNVERVTARIRAAVSGQHEAEGVIEVFLLNGKKAGSVFLPDEASHLVSIGLAPAAYTERLRRLCLRGWEG